MYGQITRESLWAHKVERKLRGSPAGGKCWCASEIVPRPALGPPGGSLAIAGRPRPAAPRQPRRDPRTDARRVQGDLDRGVPEPALDDLRMLALGDQHRRMRVAEIMNSKRFTNRGTHRSQPGSSPKVAAKKWSTFRCAEHEPLSARRPCGQVVIQLLSQELGQCRLTPCCRGLGRSQDYLSTYLGERLGDGESSSRQVEPVCSETGKLTEPTAAVSTRARYRSSITLARSLTSSAVRNRISVLESWGSRRRSLMGLGRVDEAKAVQFPRSSDSSRGRFAHQRC